MPVVRLLDEVRQHLFRDFEIRYHTVFHRLNGHNVSPLLPTATTWPLALLIATIDGSFTTMPLPCENTSVFEVPRSMARSEENQLNANLML
jgi:hypothetical protein